MHSIISFPFCKPDSDTWEPNAAAGMDQVPKCCSWDGSGPQKATYMYRMLRACIACYMHVPHVTCVYCMLHMLIACQSVTHVVAGYNGKM